MGDVMTAPEPAPRGEYCTDALADLIPIAVLAGGVEQEPTWYCRDIAPRMERQNRALAEKARERQRILCAHADQNGEGAHCLEPGETCQRAPDTVPAQDATQGPPTPLSGRAAPPRASPSSRSSAGRW